MYNNDRVDSKIVNISKKELDEAIRKQFLVEYIQTYGSKSPPTPSEELDYMDKSVSILSILHNCLILPINNLLKNKKRLYICAGGFIAQVPFSALVSSYEDKNPHFLIDDYDIGNIRPSFISALTDPNKKSSDKTLLAVGNPHNNTIYMKNLDGAEKEIQNVNSTLYKENFIKDIQYTNTANISWVMDNIKKSSYEIIYFATHSMPYSETYSSWHIKYNTLVNYFKRNFNKNLFYKLIMERLF